MKNTILMALSFAAATSFGANLFPGGEFTDAKKNLHPLAGANGGEVSLHTEDGNWNRCAKLTITRTWTNEQGHVTYAAGGRFGSDGKELGIPVKGDTLYDFTIEVKGGGNVTSANIGFVDWQTGQWAKDAKGGKTSVGSVALTDGWSRFQGSFRTHPGAKRAVVTVGLWQSTQYPPVKLKVGDCVYVDNVTVEESQDTLANLTSGKGRKAEAKVVKSVADGTAFDDFVLLQSRAAGKSAPTAQTAIKVKVEEDAVVVRGVLKEPLGILPGAADRVWSGGEEVEIFFGPAPCNSDRAYTQLAFNPAGARATNRGDGVAENPRDWELAANEVKGDTWKFTVRIPNGTLGWIRPPEKGEMIGFNVCRTRAKAKEFITWAPLRDSYKEVENFGRLVYGTWGDALKRGWKVETACADRAAFEQAAAKAEAAKVQAEFDRFADLKFVAAPVAVDSDYAIPFVPREIFRAPSAVTLKAAVNEYKDLPVAILNLTDRPADYRVVLETVPTNKFNGFYTGDWGFAGLEPARVVARSAVRMKDTSKPPASTRLDPLPKMNEACTLTVPPGESGLVWFDIDLMDAKPGTYRGRVRVIPLGEPGDWVSVIGYGNRKYTGPLQDIAVELEVMPIVLDKAAAIPTAFFQHPASESEMDIFTQLGVTEYQVSPWSIGYARDKEGNLLLDQPTEGQRKTVEKMRRERAWAAKRGVKATYFVGFSTFDVMDSLYNPKKDPAVERRLWPQFVKGLKKMMNDAGIGEDEYNVETFDEPDPKRFETLFWAHDVASRTVPGMKLTLTLGAHIMKAEDMRKLDPITDSWVLWSYGYFSRDEHLAYVRDALGRGKHVWHYVCNTSPRMPIFEGYRRHAWFGEYHRLTGNQFFILHDAEGGVGERDWKAPTNGGFVYRSFDEFIPSVRYMSFRRGIYDVKYLAKLKTVAGNRPEVKTFLETAAKRVVVTEKHDRTAADRVREEAAKLILKYGK